ncbi:unnamed protein product [Prorocentrum cordatum]|uniref:PROP1-like PPR domain-containing protein n=1 Tax=Prorocentrum cordatum TaxID=2364126 RepID=A0ABN9USV8_9DINO|nr:unnamed protein product [Polarella glacialis]
MWSTSETVAYAWHSCYQHAVYIVGFGISLFAISEGAVLLLSEAAVGPVQKEFIILLLLVLIFSAGSVDAGGTKDPARMQQHRTQDVVSKDECHAHRQGQIARGKAAHCHGEREVPRSRFQRSSAATIPTNARSPLENIDEVPNSLPEVDGHGHMLSDIKIISDVQREGCTVNASNFLAVFAACVRQHAYAVDSGISIALFKYMLENSTVDDLHTVKSSLVSRFFKILTESLDEKCMQDVSVELIGLIRAHGLAPTLLIQNRIICAWRSKLPEHVVQLFMTLREEGVSLSPTVYRCLMSAYERAQPQLTLEMCDEMMSRGLKVDRAAFNAALCACSQLGKLSHAVELFNMLPHHGLAPSGKTYGIMIRLYTAADMAKEALTLFESMRAAKLEPNCYAFDDAIHCYVKVQMLAKAISVYQEMVRANIRPCERTSLFLSTACQKQGWSKARIVGQVLQAGRAIGEASFKSSRAFAPVVGDDADGERG